MNTHVAPVAQGNTIHQPSRRKLTELCPHLSDQQIEEALSAGEGIALPTDGRTAGLAAYYFPAVAGRPPVLHVVSIDNDEEHYPTPLFRDEAAAYASSTHWWSELVGN